MAGERPSRLRFINSNAPKRSTRPPPTPTTIDTKDGSSGGSKDNDTIAPMTRWAPKRTFDSDNGGDIVERGLRKALGVLSKLTIEKFETLKEQMITLIEDTIRR
jgi:hypothetical protein